MDPKGRRREVEKRIEETREKKHDGFQESFLPEGTVRDKAKKKKKKAIQTMCPNQKIHNTHTAEPLDLQHTRQCSIHGRFSSEINNNNRTKEKQEERQKKDRKG